MKLVKLKKKSIEDKIDDSNVKKKKEKKEKKKKKFFTKNKLLILIFSILIIIVSLILAFAIYIISSAPDFEPEKLYSQEATILKDKNGNEMARIGRFNRDVVTYDELPQVLIDAIVATEDSRFFQHDGFDIARFLKATLGHVRGNSAAGGASTLTMQVVKNTLTSTETHGMAGIVRKFTDIYMSIFKIEKKYTKEEILEFYVNDPWLGGSAWGVEQASQQYFGKSVSDLSLPEAALLAGIFNAPKTYNPFNNPEAAEKRRNTVLELMNLHGYISDEQLEDAKAIPVESLLIEKKAIELNKYQSFIDAVVNEIESDTGMDAYKVPMEIETTMDPNVQDILIKLDKGEYYKYVNDVVQVAVAVTDVNDGSLAAVLGRRNQNEERAYNLATQYRSHPGSTAKPIFDYGPLIEYNNASTGTYFFDEPMTYSNGQSVKNADGRYQGQETMRTALSQSRNIPAIQAFQQLDSSKIKEFVHALGVDYGDDLFESMAIGGFDGMTALELAAAYSSFARGGYYIEPYTYTKITLKETGEVIEQKQKKTKVMSEETAYMITSMLMTAANNGVGGDFRISGTDLAAKTGTSTYDLQTLRAKGIPLSASRDNWNITYSPDYAISLWYGYEKLTTKEYYTDSNRAAGIRKKLMAAIGKKIYKTNSKFEKPSGVISVEVEKESVPLQLPSDYTPQDMRISELFKEGTEPNEVSFRYDKIDPPTGGIATMSNDVINLSWNAAVGKATNTTFLQEYFNENYGQFATKYYEKRVSYNNEHIGFLGYQVYLQTDEGLTPLGFTANTSYSYNTNGYGGTYKFVIKSQYSIFKDNESDGLIIEYKNGESSNTPTLTIKSAELLANDITVGKSSGSLNLKSTTYLKIVDNNNSDITQSIIDSGKVSVTINDITNRKIVNKVDLANSGKYEITYKISGYNKYLVLKLSVE